MDILALPYLTLEIVVVLLTLLCIIDDGSGAIVCHRLETFSIVYCNNTNLSGLVLQL